MAVSSRAAIQPPISLAKASEDAPYARRWLMLPVVLVAMFMAQFDLYVVNVALPVLHRELRASQAALELIVGGYSFMYATGLITGGRLGDLFGHRKLFVWGMVAFSAASLLCALAQSPSQLVVARLLQGLTAAAMVPQVLALITAVFPAAERARALSWFGVTMGVGAVAGQVLGGVLLDVDLFGLSWRVIFLINVPIGLVTALLAQRILPTARVLAPPKLDPLGVLLVSGSLALVLVPLALGRTEHWPVWTWVCMAACLPVMFGALTWERGLLRRDGQPLLDLGLFHDRAFNWGLIVSVATFAAFFGLLFTLSLVLQAGIGLTPLQAGVTFAPLGLAFATASIVAKSFIGRFGVRVIAAGLLIVAGGLLALLLVVHQTRGSTTALDLVGPMTIIGLGNGLSVPALIGAVLAKVSSKQAGAAAGVLTTSQQFASAAGVAGLGSLFFQALGSKAGTAAYVSALEWSAAAALALALVAAAMTTRLIRPNT